MNVMEIKNNLVKVAFSAEDNLALGGFIIIEDENSPYVAQVMNLKSDTATNYAIVKLLFTFNEDGILKNYDGTIPSRKANVSKLPSSELLDIIPVEDAIVLGSLAQQGINLKVDKTILENNLLVCSNNQSNTATLINNITSQISEKSVIIDTDGLFDSERTVVLGKDFKLPLNYETINYIYENDLEDVDAISKAVIQDIFLELQNYIQTLPERYLPFDTFIDVIDAQYRQSEIPQLILLKNKLLKYKEMNIFGQDLKDILNLSIAIENAKDICIDLSDVEDNLQKEVIRYVYKILNGINEQIYCFVKVSNSNISKKLLKKYITRDNVFTTIIAPHEFKYIEEVKEVSQNVIFFAPLTLQHDFASYNSFLAKLNSDEFVVCGAHTQNIPFITELAPVEDEKETPIVPMPEAVTTTVEPEEKQEEQEVEPKIDQELKPEPEPEAEVTRQPEEDVQAEEISTSQEENFPEIKYPDIEETSENESFETLDALDTENAFEPQIEEDNNNDNDDEVEDIEETIIDEPISEDLIIEEPVSEISDDTEEFSSEENNFNKIQPAGNILDDSDTVFEPLDSTKQDDEDDFSTIESADEIEIPEIAEEPRELTNDEMVEQVAKDVDKALYEKLPSDDDIEGFEEDAQPDLTEDDLNLIDDLTADEDIQLADSGEMQDFNIEEDEELPPVVPIYPTEDDLDEDDGMNFEPGEKVYTAKHGEGVVEKMIKYGNKMLCSIDFPNIGRRLLDPSMTEIKRID
mgnify:FL=1